MRISDWSSDVCSSDLRHFNIFCHGQRRKQCSTLKQHAPPLANGERLLVRPPYHRLAENLDFPFIGNLKANDRTHQHGFARARSADHTQNLSPAHVEIQMFMHDLIAKTVAQAAHTDRDIIILHRLRDPFLVDSDLFFFRHTQPIQVKKTAKKESSTITRKIACTTAAVVRRPTSSAFPSTCMPWKQPELAMIIPKTGALTNPTYKSVLGTTTRHRWMTDMGGISSETAQRKPPP